MNYLEVAIEAALRAGKAILEVYGLEDVGVEIKEDASPLTLADQKSNAVINSYIAPTPFPIISEENKQLDYDERKDWDSCWIVDPLDGTKEFIKRNGEFTVNIALVKQGVPELGVIYVPVTEELYFASVSQKQVFKAVVAPNAAIVEVMEKAEKIGTSEMDDIVRVVGSRSHMNQDTLDYMETLKSEFPGKEIEVVSKGSSLKFCLVAEGKADVYPRFAPTMEWDTAAGQAICEAAGLEVIAKDTNAPMVYNKSNLLNPYFLVRKG
ncbi:3'(2'), 5'-bisphosphate nucleotidase [Pustulibacterium marinum]|uniref:3'(2'),5'-bisphosphate nucleotidase CysQ n=1 Tax=Pustulibacterium marinum TaxID=1224947 RepID=A0A1I7F1C5_9FLAO|nr:3'(2'),5'-bisphosphate nucleotidase CysQ [Pustulibacterium marinum]SFU29996.1 3'(2'), 5'-bisphosphate nucleotidase [Pustulibacterium marinum]